MPMYVDTCTSLFDSWLTLLLRNNTQVWAQLICSLSDFFILQYDNKELLGLPFRKWPSNRCPGPYIIVPLP